MRLRSKGYHACILAAWLALGCSQQSPLATPVPVQAEHAKPPPWPDLARVKSWPVSAQATAESGGHSGDGYSLQVRVNPAARATYTNLVAGAALPAHTILAQFQQDHRGKPGPIYVMEKQLSDAGAPAWRFTLLDSEGRIRRSGLLPGCARCHSEAPSDSVFGPARKLAVSPASAP